MGNNPDERRERRGVSFLLAWVGGFVDGVGYLVLLQMFTAHLSGNTIASGVQFGGAHWAAGLHRFFPIPLFLVGVACGRTLVVGLCRLRVRSLFAVTFALEALLLGLFLGLGLVWFRDGAIRPDSALVFYLLAALPCLAMGVQNATLRRVGGETIRTTYITGGLTDLAEGVVDYASWLFDRFRRPVAAEGEKPPSLANLATLLASWVGFFLGAVLGALAEQSWHLPCLLIPIGCLLLLAGLDLVTPFARGEERAASVTGGACASPSPARASRIPSLTT